MEDIFDNLFDYSLNYQVTICFLPPQIQLFMTVMFLQYTAYEKNA